MRSKRRRLSAPSGFALLALLICILPGAARADESDPPGRVARLSDTEGAVSLQPAGMQEWTAATLNRPLTTGDKLWSEENSRAEVDLGAAVMRLGNSTGFCFLNLDDSSAQMQLTAGTLIVRVRDMQRGQSYEIDTPNIALSLQQTGEYRVEVNEAGDTTVVKVSEGAAQAVGGGQTVAIGAQQRARFTGTDTLAYESATLGAPDDLDNWSAARERQVEDSPSAEYVPSDVPGMQDLDNNGRWQETPDYGYVWMPTVLLAGWVPYRFGHWVWITPWGWTWVDDAPWGYAPFHYGRWVQWHNAWCWVPGPRRVRPVYAPALVAWVGGPAVGASVAFGSNVGWFPLGPREVYVPAYRVSSAYVRDVNITNTTLVNNTYITNVYQNRITPTHYVNDRAAAVTTVPQNIFTSGQRVGAHAVHLSAAALAGAAVVAAAPAIAPIRQSVLGPAEGRGVARAPAALVNRTVVARTPPPPAPAPFDQQLAAIQANGGHPLARAEIAQLQPATSAAHVRVIAATGPVIPAGTLPHRAGTARPTKPAAQAGAAATPSLAERERALRTSRLPPAPRPSTPASPPGTHADTYAPQTSSASQWRKDRPPSAQPHPPPTPPPAVTREDATRAHSQPSAPAYRAPVASEPQESPRTETPHAAPPPARPAPHPQAPARAPSSKEPRDSALHGDRESRERVLR
jgi:hypothetical protein